MADSKDVYVVGVGMTKFEKPLTKKWDYPDMGKEAGTAALADAGLRYEHVQAAVCSYCYGEPTCGQRAVYELGLSGIPVYNVNNNCSSGSTALMLARQLVQAGSADCVLALGFEKMEAGLSQRYDDKVSPVGRHFDHMTSLGAAPGLLKPEMTEMSSEVVKLFAYAAREYMEKTAGASVKHLVEVAYKNRKQGASNPKASLRKQVPRQVIRSRGMLCEPLTFWMSAAVGDGGAAAVLCSPRFAHAHGLVGRAVRLAAQHMVTDLPSSFGDSYSSLAGLDMAERAARLCYEKAQLSAQDVDVIELHDCFASNELALYEALGLCAPGKAPALVDSFEWEAGPGGAEYCRVGGRWFINPSGGLHSKGHPIGATGLAQCYELVMQLRDEAGPRQVPGRPRTALQHNFGIGGACVVTLYQRLTPAAKL